MTCVCVCVEPLTRFHSPLLYFDKCRQLECVDLYPAMQLMRNLDARDRVYLRGEMRLVSSVPV